MIDLPLIFSTAALVLALVAIHRYNTYHKGLNELVQRADKASNFHIKVEEAITTLEQQVPHLETGLDKQSKEINSFKTDFETVRRTVNQLASERKVR